MAKKSISTKRKQVTAAKQAGKKKYKAVKFQNAQVRAALDSQVHSVYTIKAVHSDDRRLPDVSEESMNGLSEVLRDL